MATMVMSIMLAILALTCLSNAAAVPAQDQSVTVNLTAAACNGTNELPNTLSPGVDDPFGHKHPHPMNASGGPPCGYEKNHTIHGHPLPYHGHNATATNFTDVTDKDTTVAAKTSIVPTTLSTVRMMPSAAARDDNKMGDWVLNCQYDHAATWYCMDRAKYYCGGRGQLLRLPITEDPDPDWIGICPVYCQCALISRLRYICPDNYNLGMECFNSPGTTKADAAVIDAAAAAADTVTDIEAVSTTMSTDMEVVPTTLSTISVLSSVVSRDVDMAEKNEFALNCDYEKNTTMWCMTKVGWYCNANGIMIRRDIPDIDEYDICESICKCVLVPKVTFLCPATENANAGIACFKSPGTNKARDLAVIDGPATTATDVGIQISATTDAIPGSQAVSTTVPTGIDIPHLVAKEVDTADATEIAAAENTWTPQQNTWALSCDSYSVMPGACLSNFGYYCSATGKVYHRQGAPTDPDKRCSKYCECVQLPKSAYLCPGIDDIVILCE